MSSNAATARTIALVSAGCFVAAFALVPLYEIACEKVFGITVHHVDEGVDTGKVIEQVRFERHAGERLEDLIERGKRIEWELYGRVLRTLNEKGRL